MFCDIYSSPLGQITMLSNDGKSLCALFFSDMNRLNFLNFLENSENSNPARCKQNSENSKNSAQRSGEIFAYTKNWLDIYFSGQKPDFTPKLDLNISEFKARVYEALPSYSQSTSYGAIAKNIAKGQNKISAQAVGTALAKNPILLIIPCHRVLGSHKQLKGYAAGIWRKKELLKLEKIAFEE